MISATKKYRPSWDKTNSATGINASTLKLPAKNEPRVCRVFGSDSGTEKTGSGIDFGQGLLGRAAGWLAGAIKIWIQGWVIIHLELTVGTVPLLT